MNKQQTNFLVILLLASGLIAGLFFGKLIFDYFFTAHKNKLTNEKVFENCKNDCKKFDRGFFINTNTFECWCSEKLSAPTCSIDESSDVVKYCQPPNKPEEE